MSDNVSIKLSNIHRRALLKRDYRRETQMEKSFWTDYEKRVNKERNKSSLISFGLGVVGGIFGFATGGVAGAKAGFQFGQTVGKAGRMLDGGRFDSLEYLSKYKREAMGKFNVSEDKQFWQKAVSNAKDDELASQLDLGLNMFKSFTAMGMVGDTVHGKTKDEWEKLDWFGKDGKIKTAFADLRKSNLEKLKDFYAAEKNIIPDLKDADPFTSDISRALEFGGSSFILDDANINKNALTSAFGDILPESSIKKIANKSSSELLNIMENAVDSNDTAQVLKNTLDLDIEKISLPKIELKDSFGDGGLFSSLAVDEDLMSHDELNNRWLEYNKAFKDDQDARWNLAPSIERPKVPIESEDEFFDEDIIIKDTNLEDFEEWVGAYEKGGVLESKRYKLEGDTFIDNLTNEEVPIEEWYSIPDIRESIRKYQNLAAGDGMMERVWEYNEGPFNAQQWADYSKYMEEIPGASTKDIMESIRSSYADHDIFALKGIHDVSSNLNEEALKALAEINQHYTYDVPSFDGYENLTFNQILNEANLDPFDVNAPYLAARGIQDAIDYFDLYKIEGLGNPSLSELESLDIDPNIWNWLINREIY